MILKTPIRIRRAIIPAIAACLSSDIHVYSDLSFVRCSFGGGGGRAHTSTKKKAAREEDA